MTELGWHLELSNRDWIVWGYGPRGYGVHIAPANIRLAFPTDLPVEEFWLPFELPAKQPDLPAPRIYERFHAWGWRFRMDTLMHETPWRLTYTRDEALEEAAEWIETSPSVRPSERPIFRQAMEDVKVTVLEDEPKPSVKDWHPKEPRE